ncbi:9560_t:CDS:2 [Dentiscutata erythropus]|uniref:9560_t:CDS:1 n=1 Tax=Dentiscutata erythropus TaxID=1348616 RepID=A0A9N9HAM0_9GLOM|nr:9560_t:CDS:2 [Dentiscutata erythropus]
MLDMKMVTFVILGIQLFPDPISTEVFSEEPGLYSPEPTENYPNKPDKIFEILNARNNYEELIINMLHDLNERLEKIEKNHNN